MLSNRFVIFLTVKEISFPGDLTDFWAKTKKLVVVHVVCTLSSLLLFISMNNLACEFRCNFVSYDG